MLAATHPGPAGRRTRQAEATGSTCSIARLDPRTPDELLDAHGVGPEKLRLYGEDVLETLREHASGAE